MAFISSNLSHLYFNYVTISPFTDICSHVRECVLETLLILNTWDGIQVSVDNCLFSSVINVKLPIVGCVATVGALGYGLFSFIRGNAKMQQSMMRARVLAQGSTVLAVIAGLGYELFTKNKKSKQE